MQQQPGPGSHSGVRVQSNNHENKYSSGSPQPHFESGGGGGRDSRRWVSSSTAGPVRRQGGGQQHQLQQNQQHSALPPPTGHSQQQYFGDNRQQQQQQQQYQQSSKQPSATVLPPQQQLQQQALPLQPLGPSNNSSNSSSPAANKFSSSSSSSSSLANSYLNNHFPSSSNNRQEQESVFKKIRGILNKLTPEKFEKLVTDIISIGIDSSTILNGVIILIVEKALDEPKYSSMYAQLCKKLDDRIPNLDKNDELAATSTFRRMLLHKCRDEFENRTTISKRFENMEVGATDDEEEARYVAKKKMLGNIRFIGELGKLQIVNDTILHRCCEQLLVGRKKQPIPDQAEDLECLCHLMKTCGRILDTDLGRPRMDQYFERLDRARENDKLPIRIRFIIQDLVEMRRNKWMPRRVGVEPERGPRTIQQVREDAARDGCIYMPQDASPPSQTTPPTMGMMNPFDFKRQDDFFGGSGLGTVGSSGPGSGAGRSGGGFFGTHLTGGGGGYSSPMDGIFGIGLDRNGYLSPTETATNPSVVTPAASSSASSGSSKPLFEAELPNPDRRGRDSVAAGPMTSAVASSPSKAKGSSPSALQGTSSGGYDNVMGGGRVRSPLEDLPERGGTAAPISDVNGSSSENRRRQSSSSSHHRDPFERDHQSASGHGTAAATLAGSGGPSGDHQGRGGAEVSGGGGGVRQQQQQGFAGGRGRGGQFQDGPRRGSYKSYGGGYGPTKDDSKIGGGPPGGGPSSNNDFGGDRRDRRIGGGGGHQHGNSDWAGSGGGSDGEQQQRFGRDTIHHRPESSSSGADYYEGGRRNNQMDLGRRGRGNNNLAGGSFRGRGGGVRFDDGPTSSRSNYVPPHHRTPAAEDSSQAFDQPPRFFQQQQQQGGYGPGTSMGDSESNSSSLPPRFKRPQDKGPAIGPQQQQQTFNHGYHSSSSNNNGNNLMMGNSSSNSSSSPFGGKDIFRGGSGSMSSANPVDLSLRPLSSANNMLLKPKTPSLLPKSAIGKGGGDGPSPLGENSLLGQPHRVMMQPNEQPILIKQSSIDAAKAKKDKKAAAAAAAAAAAGVSNKGPTRDEIVVAVDSMIEALFAVNVPSEAEREDLEKKDDDENEKDSKARQSGDEAVKVKAVADRWADGWLKPKMAQVAVTHVFKRLTKEPDRVRRETILAWLAMLSDAEKVKASCFLEALEGCLREDAALINGEVMADVACWMLVKKLVVLAELSELAGPLNVSGDGSSQQRPFLFLVLGRFALAEGKEVAKKVVDNSDVKLIDQLAQGCRNDTALAAALEEHDLLFLKPILAVKQNMSKMLKESGEACDGSVLANWIAQNVPAEFHGEPEFVFTLFYTVFDHILASSAPAAVASGSGPTVGGSSNDNDAEKEMVAKFRAALHQFATTNDSSADQSLLQLTAVYALQVLTHDHAFPKGMLLRAFVNCYDLDVLDEQAFLRWREDVNDSYPGKGKALFQVNQWLTWLEEAESEDEDEED